MLASLDQFMSPAALAVLVGILASMLYVIIAGHVTGAFKKLNTLYHLRMRNRPAYLVEKADDNLESAILQRAKIEKRRLCEEIKQTRLLKSIRKNGGDGDDGPDPSGETQQIMDQIEAELADD